MPITTAGKKRGRPPKVEAPQVVEEAVMPENEEAVVAEPLEENTSGVKIVIRALSVNNQFNPDGSMPVMAVEDYINSYLNNGYKLMSVHYTRTHTAPDSPQPVAVELLFVLYKE